MSKTHPDRVSSETLVASRSYGPEVPKISDQALIEQLTTERDRYASMLLAVEQELAKAPLAIPDELEWYREAFRTLSESRSWRATKPLRTIGHAVRRIRHRGRT